MTVNPEWLHMVYTIVQEVGLSDSLLPCNIPFSKDGRMAFVDMEYHHKWPIPFDKITPHLSPPMQYYWNLHVRNQGFK